MCNIFVSVRVCLWLMVWAMQHSCVSKSVLRYNTKSRWMFHTAIVHRFFFAVSKVKIAKTAAHIVSSRCLVSISRESAKSHVFYSGSVFFNRFGTIFGNALVLYCMYWKWFCLQMKGGQRKLCVHLGTTLIEYKYILCTMYIHFYMSVHTNDRYMRSRYVFNNHIFPSAFAIPRSLHGSARATRKLLLLLPLLGIQQFFSRAQVRLPSGIGHIFYTSTEQIFYSIREYPHAFGYMWMRLVCHSPIIMLYTTMKSFRTHDSNNKTKQCGMK